MHSENSLQAVYDQGKEQIVPALAHLCFFNNTCHLIVLSLSYLHRYSWVPHSPPAETYWFFVFVFNVLSHSFLKELYLQP